jgi:flagellar hook assembly protein FlgD
LVKTLANEYLERGKHTIQWNGDNDNNRALGSGIYFIKYQDNKHKVIKKAVLLK